MNAPQTQTESGDYSPAQSASVPAEWAGQRLDVVLARLFSEHSRSRLQAWLKEERILVDAHPAQVRQKVCGGERIDLVLPADVEHDGEQAQDIPLNVVHEDEHLLVINKPAGLVVHPGNGNRSGTLMNALLFRAPSLAAIPRAGIVHRLDKDTSGLLVIAKTLPAQTDLVRQLQARTVKRHYLALAGGRVERDGTVDAPIGRHPTQRTKMAVVRSGGRDARTHFHVREHFACATLLECRLETGRTHQIRVHMATLKHPLIGDAVYGRQRWGDERLDTFSRQALHAWQLSLVHPQSGMQMTWEASLPDDFAGLLECLRGG